MYHRIQTLAYQFDADALTDQALWRLRVPRSWRERTNALARRQRRDKPATVPVVSLNRVVQYLLPDQVVTAHRRAWQVEGDEYWLTALEPIQSDLLHRIVAAWLRQAFPGEGAEQAAQLDPKELVWEGPLSPRWAPDARFLDEHNYWFDLLPHVVSMYVARAGQFPWGHHRLELRRVADEQRRGEMISWPPWLHGKSPWSLRARFRLVTFADLGPRLHLHLGVRLWENPLKRTRKGEFRLDAGRRTLYVARHGAWLDGEAHLPVFVPITIQHRWISGPSGWQGETGWGDALMAAVLSDLSLSPLPDVGDILGNLERARQEGIDGFVAALVHPPQEKGHRVRPGLGVADLAQLFDSISKAVPFLAPVDSSPRNKLGNATRRNRLRKWEDIGTDERREAVVATYGEPPTIRLFWQTEAMRDAVTEALNREFGGAIIVEPVRLGELGRRLDLQDGSRDAQWAAVKQRAEEVAAAVAQGVQGAVVELQWDRQGGQTSPADPKAAIRLGLARAGLVSQFLQPPDEEQNEMVTAENHRVTGAVRDLMRQLGILLDWPRPVLRGDAVAETSLVGLTTIRKNTGRRGRRRYDTAYLPVMVWMSTTDSRVLVHYPGASGWATYREAATQLVAAAETDWYDNRAAVHHWLQERLLRDILPEGRTLLMVDGYRNRNWWGWMTNTAVTVDDLKFGDRKQLWAPVHDPRWENLRIVRILSGDSEETAQWFGTDGERVGVPHGLFRLSERTFLSAQEIPGSAKRFLRPSESKLDRPGKQGWLPRLMEAVVLLNGPGEDPVQWAAIAHHLRIMASHHREALMLPLPLHLGLSLEEYVLPLPEDETEE